MAFRSVAGKNPGPAESLASEIRLSAQNSRKLLDRSADPEDAARWLRQSERQVNPTALYDNTKSVFETASAALDAVKSLREKQYAMADAAADINDPIQTARFQSEYSNISAEITRISSSAAFNSQSALSGVGISSNNSSPDILQLPASRSGSGAPAPQASNLGDFSGVAASVSATLTAQSSAQTAVDTLEDWVQSARTAADSAKSRLNKANSAIADVAPSDAREFRAPEIRSSSEAESKIKDIAKTIRDTINQPDPTLKILFNNLDPSRVLRLLE